MIQTIDGVKNVLNNYNAEEWLESSPARPAKKSLVENVMPQDGLQSMTNGMVGDQENLQSFGEFLASSLSKVNSLQHDANQAMQELATGKTKNIHETLLAVERAEIAFKTMNQVRLKVLDAYKEIMRMQV